MDDKTIVLLEEIKQELKWHSKQNDKIIELLGKTKKPCGADMEKLRKIMGNISGTLKDSHPLNPIILEMLKEDIDGD